MSTLAPCRALACPGEGRSGGQSCSDRSNRRGQDKSHNVRPVGWGHNSSDNSNLRHIAALARTLSICATARISPVFYTLRVRP